MEFDVDGDNQRRIGMFSYIYANYLEHNCYLTYTSNNHIERYLKRTNQQEP